MSCSSNRTDNLDFDLCYSTSITINRPKKTDWMLAKHKRFCGKTHKWSECCYNPDRLRKVMISCPSCGKAAEVLCDFGKCRKCLHGNMYRQRGYDRKWTPQGPKRILQNEFILLEIEFCKICKEFVFTTTQKKTMSLL
jgi:hypothetical protein